MTEPDSRWVVDVSSYPPPAQLDLDVVYAVLGQITADPEPCLVGPWEPAEQPEPARCGCGVERTCGCWAEPDDEPAHGGTVATQPAVHAEEQR